MAISQIYSPEEMRRVGGGRGDSPRDDFAGLGGAFAGPGSEFVAGYLQNRISGMNRATVSPRVNQRRVMASPEFALAKTLGISTPYNSGGSQVDVQGARRRMNSPSSMERDAAQSQLNKFQQRSAGAPMDTVLEGAGLGRTRQQEEPFAGPLPSQSGFDQIQQKFGKPLERIAPVQQSVPTESAPQPTLPAESDQASQTARPISPAEAEKATQAPISGGGPKPQSATPANEADPKKKKQAAIPRPTISVTGRIA